MPNSSSASVTAYLGLGANLGDRLMALRGARGALHEEPDMCVEGASALYETAPLGAVKGQEDYLNAVLQVSTRLPADKLLYRCLAIEARFGRRRIVHHGPRTLDIDLLFYGDLTCRERDLVLPHPRLHMRAFVLVPLCDLAPELRHPLLNSSVRELLQQLPADQKIRQLTATW